MILELICLDFASSPAAAAEPSRSKPARTGANKMKKYAEDSDEEEQELRPVAQEEDSQESLPLPVPKKAVAVVETVDLDEEDEDAIADAVGDKFDVSSSDEEVIRKVVAKKAAPRKLGPSMTKESTAKVKMGSSKPASKKAVAVKKKFVQSSDDEKPVKKAKGRQVIDSGDDSDFEVENVAPRPRTTGIVKYHMFISCEVVCSIAWKTPILFLSIECFSRNCTLDSMKVFLTNLSQVEGRRQQSTMAKAIHRTVTSEAEFVLFQYSCPSSKARSWFCHFSKTMHIILSWLSALVNFLSGL